MAIGTQFLCTKSLHSMQTNVEYYFAGRRPSGSEFLVFFFKTTGTWNVRTLEITSNDFADFIRLGVLEKRETQRSLPVWLEAVESVNFDEINSARYKGRKQSYREIVELRMQSIAKAAENHIIIMKSSDIDRELSRFCPKQGPVINRGRYKLWFWAFTLHGQNQWALMPPFQNCGTWSRDAEKHRNTKFGRKGLVSSSFNSPSNTLGPKCVKGFLKYCKKLKSLSKIHRETLKEIFGVKEVRIGRKYLYTHPRNEPFPSITQFRYRVLEALGEQSYYERLYSAKHQRRKAAHNVGRFTSEYLNILDTLVTDAFTVEQIPLSLTNNGAVELLYCVRGRCPTTGAIVGVGFSLGGEDSDAYRSMLFCCAVPRDLIARVYGLPTELLSCWIAKGVSRGVMSDRGPGASVRPGEEKGDFAFSRGEIIPSRDGQGNALSESSHPRERKLEGHEERSLSTLNVIEHVKLELIRAVRDNETGDMTERLSAEAVEHFLREDIVPTPHAVWNYLDDRHCTNAVQISEQQAVRTFLKEVTFKLSKNGVTLNGRTYSDTDLIETPFFRNTPRGVPVVGYVVPCSVRIAWIEVEGKLVEVKAEGILRTQDDALQCTFSETAALEKDRKRLKSMARQQRSAATSFFESAFESETGKKWVDNQKSPPGKRVKRARNTTDKSVIDS